ncbi:flagellar basal body L-ring protein FlgH [Pseudobdellovibrio exovorus]|uniref:Flagellar L-ring protein n=1 Tax=Pseudobdellovibrio exovorus JSS TaxID=1184267 RepID=M4V9T1_9BACT|nr:flagellar basal body L-ring protein FlgH [Pseudobdellovibrio exovorus]AGH94786.1 flagellar L-ring protein [Pseudobdellovibrio exovorus JSS]
MKKILSVLVVGLFFQGCASWLTEDDHARIEQEMTPVVQPAPVAEAPVEEDVVPDEEPLSRYSQLNNMAPPSDRQYKRMTRERMEFESELNSSAGSLWKMEGQSAYLFAENKHRRQGDPTAIKMEGAALKMVENKVAVIQDLLGRLEEQRIKAEEESRIAGEEKIRLAQYEAEQKFRAEQIAKGVIKVDPEQEAAFAALEAQYLAETRKPASVAKEANPDAKDDKIDLKEVELIPSKIVEKMAGDTYRIRGQQYLTIKNKPYKVIATAVVRMEDFSDAGVSSNKLLDAQYDVVHVKRTTE